MKKIFTHGFPYDIIEKEASQICDASLRLIQCAGIQRHEILFVQIAAIHGSILLGEKIGKAAENGGVVGTAQLVQSLFGAECVIEKLFLRQYRRMACLNAAQTHVQQIVDVCLLVVGMRHDGDTVRLIDDVDDLFHVGGEEADLRFDLRLQLLGWGKGVGNELWIFLVTVDPALLHQREDLRIIEKVIVGGGVQHVLPGNSGTKRAVSESLLEKQVAALSVSGGRTFDQLAHGGIFGIKIIAQQMKSRVQPLHDELASEQGIQSRAASLLLHQMYALDGIVIGQYNGTVTHLLSQRDQLSGGVYAIGIGRMKVTVCKHDIIAF